VAIAILATLKISDWWIRSIIIVISQSQTFPVKKCLRLMTVLPSRSAVSGTWSPDVNEATSVVSRCSSSTSEHSSASVAYENENMVDSVNVHTAATTINDVQSLRASSPPEPVTRRGLQSVLLRYLLVCIYPMFLCFVHGQIKWWWWWLMMMRSVNNNKNAAVVEWADRTTSFFIAKYFPFADTVPIKSVGLSTNSMHWLIHLYQHKLNV